MIKIPAYREHPNGQKIYFRYLFLLLYVLPFAPEDILDGEQIEVDELKITAEDFKKNSVQKFGRYPRKRSSKYRKLLRRYKAGLNGDKPEVLFLEDQLLAANILSETCKELFAYLYKSKSEWTSQTIPEMNRKHLRELLLTKMDSPTPQFGELPQIDEENARLWLNNIFRYHVLARNSQTVALMKEMDVQVCPYCNRQYTVTAIGTGGSCRPQFDHYKSKMKYPYFAVSLLNLVPCCGFCNQRKGDKEISVLYPYADQLGTEVVFRTKCEKGVRYLLGEEGTEDEFSLELAAKNGALAPEMSKKLQGSDQAFHLMDLYNEHKDYVLQLFRKRYIYSEEYLELLNNEFQGLFESREDMKRMFYLMDIDPEKWGRRPLSKLTYDIDCEIEELMEDATHKVQ